MFSYLNSLMRIPNPEEKEEREEEKKEENDITIMNPSFFNEDYISKFTKLIEWKLENLEENWNYTNITEYTYMVIDGILVNIFIGKEKNKNTFRYHITFPSYYITSDDTKQEDRDIYCYRKDGCKDVRSIVEDIEEVKTYYKFMEHELLSPEQLKYAKMQRTYFPMPLDKKCSVCYESTCQYTVCNHLICFRCRYKCIDSGNFMCPICRDSELRFFPSELE